MMRLDELKPSEVPDTVVVMDAWDSEVCPVYRGVVLSVCSTEGFYCIYYSDS